MPRTHDPAPLPRFRRTALPALTLLIAAAVTVTSCGTSTATPSPSGPTPSVEPPSAPPSVQPSAKPPASHGSTKVPGPSPRIVLVDGREVQLDCRGEGQPRVILESGLGLLMATWDGVIGEIATTARVCRYDRPRLPGDEPGDLPRTSDRMVEQLRGLLAAAGESPPYILVGHSLGGLNVQLFARTHPDEVLGVVFVDAIHPELEARLASLLSSTQIETRRSELAANDEGVTLEDIRTSERQAGAAPAFPPVSTVVLRHGRPFESIDPAWPSQKVESLWAELAADLAGLGDPPRPVVVATASGHRIQEDQPRLVIEAIAYCLEGVR